MKPNRTLLTVLILSVVALLLSACSIDVTRNSDGSLTAEATMTEESFSNEVALALGDREIQNTAADMHEGHITVSGERADPAGGDPAEIAFRIDLGVEDGGLTVTISDFTVNGLAVSDERIEQWNQRIAERLERYGDNHPRRALQSVAVTDTDLTMVWRIETPRSQNDDE